MGALIAVIEMLIAYCSYEIKSGMPFGFGIKSNNTVYCKAGFKVKSNCKGYSEYFKGHTFKALYGQPDSICSVCLGLPLR